MMIERQVAIALAGVSLAMMVPNLSEALRDEAYAYGAGAAIGTLLATATTAFGGMLSWSHTSLAWRYGGFAAYLLVALGFSAASAACAWQVDAPAGRAAALALASAPLLTWGAILYYALRYPDGR